MYEHQTNLSETKAEHLVALKLAQDDHVVQENEFIKDKTELKKIQKEQELAYINEIRALKLVRCIYNNFLQSTCIYYYYQLLYIVIEKMNPSFLYIYILYIFIQNSIIQRK